MSGHQANVERFHGFAASYDEHRPRLPATVPRLLARLTEREATRVIDLGSGTGLSTRAWAGWTREVIGIEPSADMRRMAESASPGDAQGTRVRYQKGFGEATGLPDRCADIVCCSQSFHWMEPGATLREAVRLLRDGGVFATIDCDWPPSINVAVEQAYHTLHARIQDLETRHGIRAAIRHWPKDRHLSNIADCGHFRYTREIFAGSEECGSAARLVGLVLSLGSVQSLLKLGLDEEEIGLTAFRTAVNDRLGTGKTPWYFSYRIRLGVR